MALPSWRAELPQSYTGARKWGTGINPVHARRINVGREDMALRNALPNTPYDSAMLESHGLVDPGFDAGYTFEDDQFYEHPADTTYLSVHPSLGDPTPRGSADDYPSWGPGGDAIPGGTSLRSYKMGVPGKEQTYLQVPSATVSEGYRNKEYDPVPLDARIADDSQLYIQTSMVQRDAVQTNSHAVSRGTDDDRHSIASRIVGMQIPSYSGGQRHEEMERVTQDGPPRSWLHRTAGTGPASWMEVNSMYVSEPMKREIPADVYQGPAETTSPDMTDYADYNTGDDYFDF